MEIYVQGKEDVDYDESEWTYVSRRGKKTQDVYRTQEPCWFFNNGGCKHKDGSEKHDNECVYRHVYSNETTCPIQILSKRPCDKYNLEGKCSWGEQCKYSHRLLQEQEWTIYYPMIPYAYKHLLVRQPEMEKNIQEIYSLLKIIEFKLKRSFNDTE